MQKETVSDLPLVNQRKDKVPTKISSEHRKTVISVKKKDISSMTIPSEERRNLDFSYKSDWEIAKKLTVFH